MPFFSVVIPLYNKEKFVRETLRSVLSQTFTDFEIIVVDDASTDGSLNVVKSIASDRIRIVSHEKNKGLSAARNTGIRNSSAEFIAFVDADDLWKPFFLEKMRELISRFPHAGVFASGYTEKYPGVELKVKKNIDLGEGEMNIIPDFFKANLYQPIFWYGSAVVRKAVFESVGYFDETITFGEDTDFNIRAGLQFSLAYYNRTCAVYTMDSENQITTASIGNKTVTDFDKYEAEAAKHPSLKKYLDANRYFLAANFRLAGNEAKWKQLTSGIDAKNLTASQKFLLHAPAGLIKILRKIKKILLKKGIRLTTFRN